MQSLLYCFALVIGTLGAPIACPQQNITVTSTYYQPPTLVASGCYGGYNFVIPSDSYANIKISLTGQSISDYVTISDNFGTLYHLSRGSDFPGDPTRAPLVDNSATINFPSNFKVGVSTAMTTALKIEMTVTLKKLAKPTSVNQATTNVNKQPTPIYFKDWTVGTSYTFTSQSASSKIVVVIDSRVSNDNYYSLSNIFVTDGVRKATAAALSQQMFVSTTNQVTIYLAEPTTPMGAILVTDYENVKGFFNYNVAYVPNKLYNGTGFAFMQGGYGSNALPGAVTVLGDKNGATPITARELSDYNEGGQFSYISGGPVANFAVVSSPIANKDLPKTIPGTMNTFMVSTGSGGVKFSV